MAKKQFMSEAEWESCESVPLMLQQMRAKTCPWKWSTRKARLFGVACCRRVWELLDDVDRTVIEVAEAVADKKKRLTDLKAAHERASTIDLGPDHYSAASGRGWCCVSTKAWDYSYALWINPERRAVCRVAWFASAPSPWGNPYDTANDARVLVSFRTGIPAALQEAQVQCSLLRDIIGPSVLPVIPEAWRGSAVRKLAEAVYEARAFERLPILADALEEAGCDDAVILSHCRQPGAHARGCWVVDRVLGKE